MENKNILRAIQFIGTQRSGSNLLRLMLNQLPEISAPHPPHILKTFFPILPRYGNLDEAQNFLQLALDVCAWVNANPVPWEGVTFHAHKIVSQCRRRSLIELFRCIYEVKAVHDNAKYWCCKSMESVNYVEQLEQEGIEPYYIHIYRDGRDVALSFLKAIVGPKHVYHLAKKWAEEQTASLKVKEKLGPSRVIQVRYETLIHDPRSEMHRICRALNVPYSDEVFEYYHSAESLNTASSGQMWKNVVKPIMSGNHDKFRREFSEEQLVVFERIAGPVLNELGYENIFWPNVPQAPFTAAELADFKHAAEERYEEVIHDAEQGELERRIPQEQLMKEILSRPPSQM
ncbi:sulfotransferase [Chryseolinea sp. T2]|uniref:sulfotransferase family protein n=1 Tax=Chryseolinea sp. T2 TaxID=3129255 RepID=UPI0030770D1D